MAANPSPNTKVQWTVTGSDAVGREHMLNIYADSPEEAAKLLKSQEEAISKLGAKPVRSWGGGSRTADKPVSAGVPVCPVHKKPMIVDIWPLTDLPEKTGPDGKKKGPYKKFQFKNWKCVERDTDDAGKTVYCQEGRKLSEVPNPQQIAARLAELEKAG